MKKNTSNLLSKSSKKDKTKTKKAKTVTVKPDCDVSEACLTVPAVVVVDISVETKIPSKKIKPRDREHYVNSKDFEEEIRGFYTTDHITIKLGECINKIANGLSYAPNFINYSYKEEMVGDAIVKMFLALKNKKFKLDSGFSPFSYFTTIAFHAFINRIKEEKKHHKAITEYREKVYNELMLDPDETGGAHIYIDPSHNNYDD